VARLTFSCLGRLVLRGVAGVVAAGLGFALLIGVAYAFPAPFFAHHVQVGKMKVYSATPLDPSVQTYLEKLDLRPLVPELPHWQGPMEIYIAKGGWRQAVFIDLLAKGAGGVTYTLVAPGHFFLSGADFAADRLLRNEWRITAPRNLTYYILHETNHLVMARVWGRVGLHRRPQWVVEGIADLAALGRPDRARMLRWLGDQPNALRDRVALGSYPRERVLADWALHHRGMAFLAGTDLSEAEAWSLMVADGWGAQE